MNWTKKRKKEPAKCHEFVPQLLLQSSCYCLAKIAHLKSPMGSRPKWLHLPGCVCLAERVSVDPAVLARATASWGLELPPGAWDIPCAEGFRPSGISCLPKCPRGGFPGRLVCWAKTHTSGRITVRWERLEGQLKGSTPLAALGS